MVVPLQPSEQHRAVAAAVVVVAAAKSATTGQMEVLAVAQGVTQPFIRVAQALAPVTTVALVMVALIKPERLAAAAVLAALGATDIMAAGPRTPA
jgi:hypothetical protein